MADPAPATPEPIVYGKNYVYGIDDVTITALEAIGIDPTEVKVSGEPAFMSEAKGPKGLIAAILKAAKKITLNVSGFILDKEDFESANHFTLAGKFFVIIKDDSTFVGDDFAKAEFTAVYNPGINGVAA